MSSRIYTTWWDEKWTDPDVIQEWSEPLQEVRLFAGRMKREGLLRVCDIGCGAGRHLIYLASQGFEVTGIDNSPMSIELCRQSLERERLEAHLELADMVRLPLEPGSIDWALAFYVLHHATLSEMNRTFNRVYEALRPGGWFLFNLLRDVSGNEKRGQEIEPNTFIQGDDPHEGIHHYTYREELMRFLGPLKPWRISEEARHYVVEAQKPDQV